MYPNKTNTKPTDWDGQYSRFAYDEAKRHMAVLKEKSRPVLDDEFNISQEIIMTVLRRTIADIFGDGAVGTGFQIQERSGASNDFIIKAGSIWIDGWRIKLDADCYYSTQHSIQPIPQPDAAAALTTPGASRTDEVYLEVWFVEVNEVEDSTITDPTLAIRTNCRLAMKWAIKVAEGAVTPVAYDDVSGAYHWTYKLATLSRTSGSALITTAMIVDNRTIISPEVSRNKDKASGYVGKTGEGLNLWNTARTYLGKLISAATTAARTWTLQNRDGVLADDTDIVAAKARANHTGTQDGSTITGTVPAATLAGTANAIADGAVSTPAKLGSNVVTLSTKINKGLQSGAFQSSPIAAGGTLLAPVGVHFTWDSTGGGAIHLEVNDGSSWIDVGSLSTGRFIISDGTRFRYRNTSDTTAYKAAGVTYI